jgi:hypothetical protein
MKLGNGGIMKFYWQAISITIYDCRMTVGRDELKRWIGKTGRRSRHGCHSDAGLTH